MQRILDAASPYGLDDASCESVAPVIVALLEASFRAVAIAAGDKMTRNLPQSVIAALASASEVSYGHREGASKEPGAATGTSHAVTLGTSIAQDAGTAAGEAIAPLVTAIQNALSSTRDASLRVRAIFDVLLSDLMQTLIAAGESPSVAALRAPQFILFVLARIIHSDAAAIASPAVRDSV